MTQTDLTERDFKRFRDIVYEKAGINLHDGKKELVRARIGKRIRQLGLTGYNEYYGYLVNDETGEELIQFLDVISTNLTSFFREKKHFDFLITDVFPNLFLNKTAAGYKIIKVWSAGCSTGEEPYTLAICINDFLSNRVVGRTGDFRILATDLSTKVLKTAKAGVFHKSRTASIQSNLLKQYFQKGFNKWEDHFRVKKFLREKIQFKRFNLIESFPKKEIFSIIFCRNVMIYFDKKTQEIVVNKFFESLVKGGYLFIGHSESLMGISHQFKYIKPTIYRKM